MAVRGAPIPAAAAHAQAKPGGASIGHILSDRMADLSAARADMAARVAKGLSLASTDSNAHALQAVMGYGHEVTAHVTHVSELHEKVGHTWA